MTDKNNLTWLSTITLLSASLMLNLALAADASVEVINLPNASVPDAETGASGTIHVAYLSDHNIYYVNSTDNGVSFSTPMRVNQKKDFAAGALFRGPDLALGKNERVSISWYNRASAFKQQENLTGFMYSRMNAGRMGFEPDRNLNHHPSDDYSLAADDNGNMAALWVDNGLYVSQSKDGGTTFSTPHLARPEPCECCGTRALYSTAGELFYLYRDKENNDRDMYLGRYNQQSNRPFPIKLNTETWHLNACPMSGSFLTRRADTLLAAWELQGGIYFSRLNLQGVIEAPGEILVSPRGRYPVVLGNGTEVLVAWKQGARFNWQLFDINGNRLGVVHSISTSQRGRRGSGVVSSNGRFLLFP